MVPDYERIAATIVNTCARIQKGDTIYIRGRKDCACFCELIALECRKQGAYPFMEIFSDTYKLKDLKESPLDVIRTAPRHVQTLIEETDFVMYVGMQPKDPLPFRLLPPERVGAERLYGKGITDIVLSHPEKRWIGIAYPTLEQAKLYNIDFEAFHSMVWNAIDIDYESLSKRAEKVASFLSGSSVIRIENPKGTDITLNIEDRPVLKDDGIISDEDLKKGDKILNLPAGEVYVAPHERKSEGRTVFDFVFFEGKACGTLAVDVSQGKVSPATDSAEGLLFKEILDHSTGDKDIIGEVGFGLNPCITKMVGNQLTDEKVIGTVHLALGENRSYGGKNQSDLHWDLIVSNPTVWVDSVLLMENGTYCI